MSREKPHENVEELIAAYLTEGLQHDELKELKQWMDSSPANKQYITRLGEIWFSSAAYNHALLFDKDLAYMRFINKVKESMAIREQRKRRIVARFLWYGAASIILLFVASYTSFKHGRNQVTKQFDDIVIEAPIGSKVKMYLPDGSLVWLNCDSKIIYSQGFGVNDRKIFLIGEAYIEVMRNEKLPFVVGTEELIIDVMGTKFNFRNYPDDKEATVTLLEGKVMVTNRINNNENIILVPNQKMFYNKLSGTMRVINVNASHTAVWTKGNLFFDEELLPDIIKVLERNYNVKIRLADESLELFRFYGDFIVTEHAVEDIIGILTKTNKIQYSIKEKDIILSATK